MAKIQWTDEQISLILRATELALEQHERLHYYLEKNPGNAVDFYQNRFEIGISNNIASLLCGAHFIEPCGHINCEKSPINPANR